MSPSEIAGIALALPVPAVIASAVTFRLPAWATLPLLIAAGALMFSLQWVQLWLGDLAGLWPAW